MNSDSANSKRVGAIGASFYATTTIWPLLAQAGLVLEAICDTHLERAQLAAQRFGISRVFDGAEAMLDQVDLDGLIIIVPPHEYPRLIDLAIQRRVPSFVEKPAGDSAAALGKLAINAHDAAVPFVIGYQRRFSPMYRQVKRLMSRDDFGPVSLVSLQWAMGPLSGRTSLHDWLIENPVHHLDLARLLAGELRDLSVRVSERRGEFAIVVAAASDSGAVVSLTINTAASWQQHNEVVDIFGVGHSICIDNADTLIYRPPERPEQRWRANYTTPLPANTTGQILGYAPELEHFAAVVSAAAVSDSDLTNAAQTLQLAEHVADLASAHLVEPRP
jgi:predicted dehydrogenase